MQRRGKQHGFTLIEILVVLIIVGLLASLAVVNMAGGSRQRELQAQVRELYLLMQTASEQAVLNNREFGLLLEDSGYQFVIFDPDTGDWSTSSERIFRPRTFPEWLVVTEHLENQPPRLPSARDDSERPEVVFFSSGESTAFELEFTLAGDSGALHAITSDGISPMKWDYPGGENEQ